MMDDFPKDGRWVKVWYEEDKYERTLGRWNPSDGYEIEIVTGRSFQNWWPLDRIEKWKEI